MPSIIIIIIIITHSVLPAATGAMMTVAGVGETLELFRVLDRLDNIHIAILPRAPTQLHWAIAAVLACCV